MIQKLKQQIKENKLDKIYYFTGEEWYVMNLYIEKICKLKGAKITSVDNVKDILEELKSGKSLFGSKIYKIIDDKDYILDEKLQDTLYKVVGNNMVIFVFNNLDKRSKFYKKYKDNLVEFNKLERKQCIDYIKSCCELNELNIIKLLEKNDNLLGPTMLEINKIKNHSLDVNASFKKLDQCGLLQNKMEDSSSVFQLIDSLLMSDTANTFRLLYGSKDITEMSFLYNLSTISRQVLQVQSCKSKDIVGATGLNAWQIKNAMNKVGYRSNRELINIMKLAQRVEESIKVGTIDASMSVEYTINKILGGML